MDEDIDAGAGADVNAAVGVDEDEDAEVQDPEDTKKTPTMVRKIKICKRDVACLCVAGINIDWLQLDQSLGS